MEAKTRIARRLNDQVVSGATVWRLLGRVSGRERSGGQANDDFGRMTQGSTVRLRIKPVPLVLAVFVTTLGALQIGCTSRQVGSTGTQREEEALKRVEAFKRAEAQKTSAGSNRSVAGANTCPGSVLSPEPQFNGGHRVILSWTASRPPDAKHSAAIGYCVYRGVKHKDPSPQLLNSEPFPGSTCTDDLVANDQKYYYVVRAISAQGTTSETSNEVPIVISVAGKKSSSVSRGSAPLCRQSAGMK